VSTERIYYFEPHQTEFDAQVLEVVDRDGTCAAILDRTAFYPTGGGQPNDTGSIAGVPVRDVLEDDDGRVLHLLGAAPPFAAGDEVHGQVNGERRLDHLQQHSAQHLLSAAFLKVADAPTKSFHLGTETSTIDLGLTENVESSVCEAVELSNRVIYEDRSMTVQILSEEEALRLPLRKEVPVEGEVRVVSIADFDATPCGGTHAVRTGEIRMLAVLRTERYKKGTRVEFVAGGRVHRTLMAMTAEAEAVGELISAPRGQRAETLATLLEERKADLRRMRAVSERAAQLEATALAAAAPQGRIIRTVFEDRSADEVAALARALAERRRTALLGAVEGAVAKVMVALPGEPHAGKLLQPLAARFGGRGGGGPHFAQAGGLRREDVDSLLTALQQSLEDSH